MKEKKDCGVKKRDLERGYQDGESKKDSPEDWMDSYAMEPDIGGFCGRPEGWER